jgi:hypothetical protein
MSVLKRLKKGPQNPDLAFWTAKLDTLLKQKENTEFKDIKILLFFDQSTLDLHIFQSQDWN